MRSAVGGKGTCVHVKGREIKFGSPRKGVREVGVKERETMLRVAHIGGEKGRPKRDERGKGREAKAVVEEMVTITPRYDSRNRNGSLGY